MSIRAISRGLDISRKIKRKYLGRETVKPAHRKGPGRPRKPAPYKGWLRLRKRRDYL